MTVHFRVGDTTPGPSIMKFTLTYDGELRSNDRPKAKWNIRQSLSPQLIDLWESDDILKGVAHKRFRAKGGSVLFERHHSEDSSVPMFSFVTDPHPSQAVDLLAPIERRGWLFCPLIRDSLLLKCGLKILFLRREDSGRIYQGGDMDNRLKTLFDALSVPSHEQICAEHTPEDEPIFCLLEDDRLISGLSVETADF